VLILHDDQARRAGAITTGRTLSWPRPRVRNDTPRKGRSRLSSCCTAPRRLSTRWKRSATWVACGHHGSTAWAYGPCDAADDRNVGMGAARRPPHRPCATGRTSTTAAAPNPPGGTSHSGGTADISSRKPMNDTGRVTVVRPWCWPFRHAQSSSRRHAGPRGRAASRPARQQAQDGAIAEGHPQSRQQSLATRPPNAWPTRCPTAPKRCVWCARDAETPVKRSAKMAVSQRRRLQRQRLTCTRNVTARPCAAKILQRAPVATVPGTGPSATGRAPCGGGAVSLHHHARRRGRHPINVSVPHGEAIRATNQDRFNRYDPTYRALHEDESTRFEASIVAMKRVLVVARMASPCGDADVDRGDDHAGGRGGGG